VFTFPNSATDSRIYHNSVCLLSAFLTLRLVFRRLLTLLIIAAHRREWCASFCWRGTTWMASGLERANHHGHESSAKTQGRPTSAKTSCWTFDCWVIDRFAPVNSWPPAVQPRTFTHR